MKLGVLVGNTLCRIGLHTFEKQPSQREPLKNTGVDFIFWTSAIQKGMKVCTRSNCTATKKVYREGFAGSGVKEPEWKHLDSQTEAYIDSLPGGL